MKTSNKPMKRTEIARRTPLRAKAPLQRSRKPMKQAGRRTKKWRSAWSKLKPRLEQAGRTSCEFAESLLHECGGPLDPCHSKKRGKMKTKNANQDINAVAIGCRTVHDYLDGIVIYPPLGRRLTHEEMEAAVMMAISQHGGMIVP